MSKNIVDFIVVGAMKAGTSSIGFHLRNHPQICMPKKEIHYFNNDINYNKGNKWYEKVLSGDKNCSNKIVGEKTPTYSYSGKVAKRIHDNFPNVKIIWIFRNPIDRAYSNYLHSLARGYEYLSFKEAIDKEEYRIEKDPWVGYKKRGIYIDQIENFLKYFPKEQMYFCIFEDFIKNSKLELNNLFNFLGVSSDNFQLQDETKNKTIMPRFPRIMIYTRKLLGNQSIIFKAIFFLNTFGRENRYPKMNKETRQELKLFFSDYNNNLAKLINKDLSVWE